MELKNEELKVIYQSVVKPFNHPDPVGFIARALLETGGDPDYYGSDDRVGFIPLDPRIAMEKTGIRNMTSLNENIFAAMTIDAMNFEEYGSIDAMIRAFHFGEKEALNENNQKATAFIKDVNSSRPAVLEIVSPRKATLKDVMDILKASIKFADANRTVVRFVKQVLEV